MDPTELQEELALRGAEDSVRRPDLQPMEPMGVSEGTRLTSRFDTALTFAAQLHSTQLRKGTTIPYIAHLMAVASMVLTHGGDENEAIAALLHDAVEDQGGLPTLEKIRARFGERVADIVESCTDSYVDPKPLWRPRKEKYVEHLHSASPSVKLVAAADKLHNLRAIIADFRMIGPKVWERFKAGPEEQLWFYRGCVSAIQKGWSHSIVGELDEAVQVMEQICRNSSDSDGEWTTKADDVRRIIEAKYEEYCGRIVQMVQALPADCRQSGDDSVLADVWEEFKYQVQRDESAVFGAYEDTITALCQKLIEGLPQHEQDLLWLQSEGYFNWNEQDELPVKADDVATELYRRVCTRASDEDLKIDPDDEASE